MYPVVLIAILVILISLIAFAFIEAMRMLACGLVMLCFLVLLGC